MNWKRGLAAFGLSLLQPGLGQVFVRNLKLGIGILLVQSMMGVTSDFTPALMHFSSLVVWVAIGIAVFITSIAHAIWIGLHQPRDSQLPAVSKTLLVVALIIAGLNFAAGVSGFIFDHLPVRAFKMSSNSGAPTLITGDRVIVDYQAYRNSSPRRGDVVIFELDNPNPVVFSKRVIGVGGDVIQGTEEGVVLNEKRLVEPYVTQPSPEDDFASNIFKLHSVPLGSFYLMGDNRPNSFDSRHFGDIRREKVFAKVLFIYWSSNHSRIGQSVR